ADLVAHHERMYRPNEAILGVAGDIDWPHLQDAVDRLFGDWESASWARLVPSTSGPPIDHIHQETAQTQISIAYNTVAYQHPEYFNAQAAVTVLSGGSSSRLFTEVREKR